ncbi:MAG TPA: hypothetical protein VGV61_01900, partial [Thermoanaerobaculia bacterium]|nr:hypothetical protein [Thermoanaerobaculia bacterium]
MVSDGSIWVLTSARLLELDFETGVVLRAQPARAEDRLLQRGEDGLPLLVTGGARAGVDDGGPLILELPDAGVGALLGALPTSEGGATVVVAERGIVRYGAAGRVESIDRFGDRASAFAYDDERLWLFGAGGASVLARSALAGPAESVAIPALGADPTAACYDELAERLVVADAEAIHWLDRDGSEVATTPLPGVQRLACGRFGRVWAATAQHTVTLRSLGDPGVVEQATTALRDSEQPRTLAADPRDFAALIAAGNRVVRVDDETGRHVWTATLGRGEVIRDLAVSRAPGRPEPPRPAAIPSKAGRPVPGTKVLPTEIAIRGRLAVGETYASGAPAGSGDPVAAGDVTVYGADIAPATTAADGTFTTPAFPHTSGRTLTVFARKQVTAGRLVATLNTSPAAGQTFDVGDLPAAFDCGVAYQNGLFPANALNGDVRAMVFNDGSGPALYVGGTFTTAGGTTVNRVAKWNGTTWSALGSGFTHTTLAASVDALTVFDDGTGPKLYAGGQFNRSGSTTINNVAKWNGTAWVQVGSGFASQVLALGVHNANLYAGGSFTTSGSTTVNRIARWTGTAWAALGSGANNTVRALASYNPGSGAALYVGGTFTQVGGSVSASRIAKWNGTAWSALGAGVTGGTTIEVDALLPGTAAGAPVLNVGGRFTTAGTVTANHVARWNGTAWSALGGGLNVQVNALGQIDDGAGTRLYAAGSFTTVGSTTFNRLARFTGIKWEPVGTGLNGNALAMGTGTVGSATGLYVGGVFTTANGVAASHLAKILRPATCTDAQKPFLQWVLPANASTISTTTPTLRLGAFDFGAAGLNTASLQVLRNNVAVPVACTWAADAVDCTPTSALPAGSVTLVARVSDQTGNVSLDQTVQFTISETTPPTIAFTAPTEGATVTTPRPVLQLGYSDVGSGVDPSTLTLQLNGSPLTVECQTGASSATCVPSGNIANGAITLSATVRDFSGNLSSPAVRHLTIATPAATTTTVRGVAVLEGGGAASGALIWVGGRTGATTTAAADGTFQIAGVASDAGSTFDLFGNARPQVTTYIGFRGGIVPVADGITDVGQFVLRPQCDSFFSPLPFVAGGPDVGGGTQAGEVLDIERFAVYDEGSGPHVFAGGDFNYGSTGTLPRVARWGTRGWEPVGSGFRHSTQPIINAFAVFDDGNGPALYAGGYFAFADGQAASSLAKWDGREWQEVGRGVNGAVTGLAVFNDGTGNALYVGGNFTRVQTRKDWSNTDVSIAANHVAKWTGSAWSQVAGGQSFSGFNMTFDLSVLRDASGDGLYLWERRGPGIWKLASGTWQSIGWTINDPTVVLLNDLVSATIGGTPAIYSTASGLGVQKRVGSSWVQILPTDWFFYSLAGFSDASGSFLYASGPFVGMPGAGPDDQLRRWNGTSWSAPLAAGGQLSILSGFEAQPVLVRPAPFSKWESNAWVPFPVTVDTVGAVSSVAFGTGATPSILFGGPTSVGGVAINGGIGRWDGTSVTAVTAGLTGGSKVVQSFDGTTAHVYGIAEANGQIAEWNGSGWTLMGSPLGVLIRDVDWIDVGGGPRLYAAGNGVYRWNGAFWFAIGGPGGVIAIEGFQGSLYAGGGFTNAGGVPARNIARWNGSAWSAVGAAPDGVDGAVLALQSFGGYLNVGGAFSNTGTNTSHFAFAAWDGSAWGRGNGTGCGLLANRFDGSLLSGSVRALTVFDDATQARLVIGGDYAMECLSKDGGSFSGRLPGYTNLNLGTGVDA